MKAIEVTAYGDADVLRVVERDRPKPRAGEVLIEVKASGINYADTMMRRGLYLGGGEPPYIPGFEVAGVIAEVGDGVQGWKVGARVVGTTTLGGYAEYTAVPALRLLPLPKSASFEEGAAFPVVFLTAYHALHTFGSLRSGESVLIQAAAGGVGTAAVQLAKLAGATVFATASSQAKLDLVRSLGADHLINYQDQDFLEVVRSLTNGRGVDLVLESVGGEVFEKSQTALAPMGRLVLLGIAGVVPGKVDAVDLLFRNKRIIGFHLGNMPQEESVVLPAVEACIQYWMSGKVRPVVGKTFPLADAADAHRYLADRKSFGKVVLIP